MASYGTTSTSEPGLRVRLSKEAGQTLVLFVFALAALMGFTALSIDVGLVFVARRDMQNAADAAALAAARELDDSPAAAIAMAQQYASANGVDLTDPSYTFEATTPYQGDPGKIEVKVSREVDFLFARALGLDFANVPARAVAEATVVPGTSAPYAVLALDTNCQSNEQILIPGSGSVITGAIHSNSDLQVSGSDNTFNSGPVTYSCDVLVGGQNNTFTSSPAKAPIVSLAQTYTYSSFPCTYTFTTNVNLQSHPEVWVGSNPSNKQLKDGVYCSTQDIQLSGQGISGNVTLVAADEVKISGSDFNLTAYYEDILAFSAASHGSAIDMSGSGGSWTGLIYAPDGAVKLQGSDNLSVSGSIVADQVIISGSGFSITAGGAGVATYSSGPIRLDE